LTTSKLLANAGKRKTDKFDD